VATQTFDVPGYGKTEFDVKDGETITADDAKAYLDSQKQGNKTPVLKPQKGELVDKYNPYAPSLPPVKVMEEEANPGIAIDLALEGGIPAAVQVATTPLTPVVQAAAGAASSFLGNAIAQMRRVAAGEQPDYSWGQSVSATATGAIPFAGPAANAEKVLARQIVKNAIKTGSKVSAISVGGENIKTLVDEGNFADLPTDIGAGLFGLVAGSSGSIVSDIGANRVKTGQNINANINDLAPLKGAASPGMLMNELAAYEQRAATLNPGGTAAQRVDEAMSSFTKGIQELTPDLKEGVSIFDEIKPRLQEISKTDSELSRLNEAAFSANSKVKDAEAALAKARESGALEMERSGSKLQKSLQEASDNAFQQNFDSALENAKAISANKIAGDPTAINPANARNLMVDFVATPAKAALDSRAETLYAPFQSTEKLFDRTSLVEDLKDTFGRIKEGLPESVNSKLNNIIKEIENNPMTSLEGMRNLRSYLREGVKFGEIGTTNEDRLMKEAAKKVTALIDEQAPSVFGDEIAGKLKEANATYSKIKDALDKDGVNILFSKDPNDSVVEKTLAGFRKSGVDSDEYKNLQGLLNVVRETNPELADQLSEHANSSLRGSIMHQVSELSGDGTSVKINPKLFIGVLEDLAKNEGSLEALGFGGRKSVAEMKRLFDKYPEASLMTKSQWENLFSIPSFKDAANPQAMSSALVSIQAKTQAENQLLRAANMRAAGRINDAEKALSDATSTAKDIGINEKQVRQKYEALLADPTAIAFNNPNLSAKDFDSFAGILFDPVPSKITNSELGKMVESLRMSPNPANRELLGKLQQRYIADRIAAYHSAPTSSQALQNPEMKSIAEFFNPVNSADAQNQIDRARVLLDSDQLKRLQEFGRTAKSIVSYEKMQKAPMLPWTYNVPVVGELRRGMDAVGDLYRSHQYEKAAASLADPRKFASSLIKTGEQMQAAESPIVRGVIGATRSLENRSDSNR
jgi:hypothetical protein